MSLFTWRKRFQDIVKLCADQILSHWFLCFANLSEHKAAVKRVTHVTLLNGNDRCWTTAEKAYEHAQTC